jgi:hypothetical protein
LVVGSAREASWAVMKAFRPAVGGDGAVVGEAVWGRRGEKGANGGVRGWKKHETRERGRGVKRDVASTANQ